MYCIKEWVFFLRAKNIPECKRISQSSTYQKTFISKNAQLHISGNSKEILSTIISGMLWPTKLIEKS
jgi:hypothetical protein